MLATRRRSTVFVLLLAPLLALFVTVVVRAQQAPAATMEVPRALAPPPAPAQPLPFSHRTHVKVAAQCQTCHTATTGAQMTFP